MPQGARLLFILNSGGETLILGNNSGATRCRAAVYSELWWDGGEELIPRPVCLPHPCVHQLSSAHQGEQVRGSTKILKKFTFSSRNITKFLKKYVNFDLESYL